MAQLRIIVTGLIAQHARLGGVAWDYLQYALGLQRLGHDVYYLEDSGEWPYTLTRSAGARDWVAHDCTPNVRFLASTMDRFGLADRWSYRFPVRPRWYGMSTRKRREVLRSADLLINVSGTLEQPAKYRTVGRLAYVDSDPVFTQVRLSLPADDLGLRRFRRRAAQHDVHFSFGGLASDAIPHTAYRWRPTRQPVVLEEWQTTAHPRETFTTVMNWTSYEPLKYRGRVYAQKDVELLRFLDLPRKLGSTRMEVALGGLRHRKWQGAHAAPRTALEANGWRVVPALSRCGGLDAYRRYIQASKAEWSVAKNGYVVGRSGWFSCRSACYLAAGRPVVVQDTGFSATIPVGEGVLTFADPDGAAAAIARVEENYARHARAAREIAAEYFDSDKVLAHLVEEAMSARG
jgi:hypothetical protein